MKFWFPTYDLSLYAALGLMPWASIINIDMFIGSFFFMALLLSKNDGVVKIISKKDGAVNCDDECYELYQKELDEDLLELDGEPTRFVLKKGLNYKDQQIVKDAQVKMDGKKFTVSLSYMMEEIRLALIDVENPKDLPELQHIVYKKASDGKTNHDLIAMLETAGVVTELYTARQHSLGVLSDTIKKK